jgi:hypothetical protein
LGEHFSPDLYLIAPIKRRNQRKTSKTELETIFLFSLSPEHLVKILIGAIKS